MNQYKEALREIAKQGKLEECAQDLINELAKVLIGMYPEVAENEPKQIGRLAKATVMSWMAEVASS